MKSILLVAFAGFFSLAAWGQAAQSSGLGILRNAQYVYVTSYDGPEFSHNLRPEERTAIAAAQEALQQSDQFIVVYRPENADMIVAVDSHPSEDVLAVYSRTAWPTGTWLWRAEQKGGLLQPDVPLVRQLEAAMERAR